MAALGLNARAALITRGLAEMTRLGVALGARAETFMGLSGLGDLVLTATGDLSRNRRVGLLLAAGPGAAPTSCAELGHVAEGVYSAPMVLARARAAAASRCRSRRPWSRCSTAASKRRGDGQLMSREAAAARGAAPRSAA